MCGCVGAWACTVFLRLKWGFCCLLGILVPYMFAVATKGCHKGVIANQGCALVVCVCEISAQSKLCHDACIHSLLAACKWLGSTCAQVCYSSWNGMFCTRQELYIAAASSNVTLCELLVIMVESSRVAWDAEPERSNIIILPRVGCQCGALTGSS